jgi:two-component system sensor histidine kinase KdpD
MIERLIQESRGMTIVVADLRRTEEQQTDAAGGYLTDLRKHLFSRSDRKQERDERDAPIFHANVLLWNEVLEKEAAIRQLLEAICATHATIPFDYAWRALLEREKQGATFIGEEIAIPHARLEGLTAPVLAVGVSKLGIIDSDSGNTAAIMFLMLSPIDRPDIHVKLLGQISKMAGDDQWRSAISRANSQIEVMQKVRQWLADRKA